MSLPKRQTLRGTLGLALAWAVLWVPLGWLALIIDTSVRGDHLGKGDFLASVPPLAALGAVSGFLFGLALRVAARRTVFANLTHLGVLLCGIATGMLIPVGYALFNGLTDSKSVFAGLSLISGASALTTLAVARRAPEIEESPSPSALTCESS
jgi:hypothetical protein